MPRIDAPISTTPVIPATFIREDERGLFAEAINAGPWETVIAAQMNPGAVLGNHYHKKTRMFFFILDGGADVQIENVKSGERHRHTISKCEGCYLEPGEAHAITFLEKSTAILLKSKAYTDADPDTFEFDVTGQNAQE